MKKKFMFPLDIQLFADDNSGDDSGNDDQGTGQDNQDSGEGGQETKTFTQEELEEMKRDRDFVLNSGKLNYEDAFRDEADK